MARNPRGREARAVIRGVLARFFAPRAKPGRWSGNHASVAEACAAGRAGPTMAGLAYVESLREAATGGEPRVVLASGVLNALEDPVGTLREFAKIASWIVLGSLPLLPAASHRVAINVSQSPPFPLWFFSENQFLDEAKGMGLHVIQRWAVRETRWHLDGSDTPSAAGLLLARKDVS